jgi:DNA-binding GntR family transcriptional regulator
MTTSTGVAAPDLAPRPIDPPSVVQLAADAIRSMILAGELRPGERLVEERLTALFGISRPPLREALRLLQHEGLVVRAARRGAMVAPLSEQDVHEIVTLRHAYERLAIELGVPVSDPSRLERCREALRTMADAAHRGDRAALVEASFSFHLAVVALAGHRRLEEAYRSLYFQMRLCMALNTSIRTERYETLRDNVERHRRLLELIERGDRESVLAELQSHGDTTFLAQFHG